MRDKRAECEQELMNVMTASEIAGEFDITREAVHKAIKSGRLPARQSAATWLIRREDAIKLWGHTAKLMAVVVAATWITWSLTMM